MFCKIKKIKPVGRGRVINLNVKKNHTFITKNGIVTHNCDYVSVPGQAMLRDLMEQVQKITRFIFMCNYGHKVIPELQSRCQVIEMGNPPIKEIAKFVMYVIKQEKIKIEDVSIIADLIKRTYPDIRKAVNTLQLNVVDNKISNITYQNTNGVYSLILQKTKEGDLDGVRKVLRSNTINYTELYEYFFEHVDTFKSPGDAIIEIAEAMYRDGIIAIKEINFISLILKLIKKGCI